MSSSCSSSPLLFSSSSTNPLGDAVYVAAVPRRRKMSSSCSSSPLLFSSSSTNPLGDAVYVAAVPLTAARGSTQLVVSAAYSAGLWDLQHFMVLIKPHRLSQAFVFDFQPKHPEDVYVAFAALSRRPVPGAVLKRKISRLPKSRCWLVGLSCPDSIDVANKFSDNWDSTLVLGQRDCRHFTSGNKVPVTNLLLQKRWHYKILTIASRARTKKIIEGFKPPENWQVLYFTSLVFCVVFYTNPWFHAVGASSPFRTARQV